MSNKTLLERLTSVERTIYQRVQAAIAGECEEITLNAMDLDRLLDNTMMSRQRAEELDGRVAELERQGEASADLIVGLAKLLADARKKGPSRG